MIADITHECIHTEDVARVTWPKGQGSTGPSAGGVSRLEVHSRVNRLHELRNRAAHHEPLLATNLPRHLADLLHVANLLDHEIGQHIAAHSKLDQLPARPAPTSPATAEHDDDTLVRT